MRRVAAAISGKRASTRRSSSPGGCEPGPVTGSGNGFIALPLQWHPGAEAGATATPIDGGRVTGAADHARADENALIANGIAVVRVHQLVADVHEVVALVEAADLAASYGDRLRIEDKRSTTDSIWSITANARPDIVFIDHLRRIKDKGDNETQRLGMMTERLSDMAKELDCHVMVLAQLNREVENQNDKRPQLKDLRDSGQIEENADQVFMLYRDSYYNASKPELKNVAELWIRKFRDGVRDSAIKLSFDEKQQWFNPINF